MINITPPELSDVYGRVFVNLQLDEDSPSPRHTIFSGLYLPDDQEIFSFHPFPTDGHLPKGIDDKWMESKHHSIWMYHWDANSRQLASLVNRNLFAQRSKNRGNLVQGNQVFLEEGVMMNIRHTFKKFKEARDNEGYLSVTPSEKVNCFFLDPWYNKSNNDMANFVLRVLCPKDTKPVFSN